jgi:nicotinate-nucleotide pyrophosphorylase (carboxylating)
MDIAEKAEGIIRLALSEDLGAEGDITTTAACPPGATGKAVIISKRPCRVAGQPVASRVFALAGPGAEYRSLVEDGSDASPGQKIAEVEGPLAAILAGERTALNFLCHLSGIATVTARLVALASPFSVNIMDTRKTTPGLRVLEKYAVSMGGGTNHRQGLFDGVIIKDNHIAAAGGLEIAVRRVRNALADKFPIEVEAASLAQVREALDSGADIIMLDNMAPEMATEAVGLIGGRAKVEVSGGVDPENIGSYVRLGMDAVSLGFITHSAPAADLSLELAVD